MHANVFLSLIFELSKPALCFPLESAFFQNKDHTSTQKTELGDVDQQ